MKTKEKEKEEKQKTLEERRAAKLKALEEKVRTPEHCLNVMNELIKPGMTYPCPTLSFLGTYLKRIVRHRTRRGQYLEELEKVNIRALDFSKRKKEEFEKEYRCLQEGTTIETHPQVRGTIQYPTVKWVEEMRKAI